MPDEAVQGASRIGRPRRGDVDQALSLAVLELLHSGGPAAVTMQAVAQASGLAKTTVYRRHPDRSALLRAVLDESIGTPVPPPAGTVREKVRWCLREAWRQMADVLGPGGLAAVIGDASPEFTAVFRSVLEPYDRALVDLIRADVGAGLLRPEVDADAVVSMFLGAYLGELVRRGSVDEQWLDRCLDLMWAAVAPVQD
ncbi:hypothetical protein ASE01_07365 [Nocardioides sp. Root190]|uniref:TetR/AcrR family transcriptional regulator n=1 Tax=Nocardioides sp. Root190 TaxID=1736488 RepID=UPI0006F57219|nr:TetR/AcrR family transcriptional regulator [Nocardioides sp. Root190]KRB77987.1 hypothetical protein ASE01_07365 [Nocardioides sp. Root190]